MQLETEKNLLYISMTINICTLIYFISGKLVSRVLERNRNRGNIVEKLYKLNVSKPWLAGKLITEQLISWILIIMAIIALVGTPVIADGPFKINSEIEMHFMTECVMAMNVGRYLYLSAQDALLVHELPYFKMDFIHHVVTVVAYAVFLDFRQNVFLSIAGVVIEISFISTTISRILRELGVSRNTTRYRNVTFFCVALVLTTRGILPIVFLVIAIQNQTPFAMDYAPLTLFFMCIIFFFVINFWMIFSGFSKARGICNIQEHSNLDTVVAHNNLSTETNLKHPNFETPKTNLIRSYDNRNICAESHEKNNMIKKKVVVKDSILCSIKKESQTRTFTEHLPIITETVQEHSISGSLRINRDPFRMPLFNANMDSSDNISSSSSDSDQSNDTVVPHNRISGNISLPIRTRHIPLTNLVFPENGESNNYGVYRQIRSHINNDVETTET